MKKELKMMSKLFYKEMGRKMNLKKPKCFIEKLIYLNFYKQNIIKSDLTDKYKVRKFIEDKLGNSKHLVKLLGVYDDAKDIDFDNLPEKFVLKCNHGSGDRYISICEDKSTFDKKEAIDKLNDGLKTTFGRQYHEIHYYKIKPKIIVEEYLERVSLDKPLDYKLWCVNGKVHYINAIFLEGESTKYQIYDTSWNNLTDDMIYEDKRSHKILKEPKNLKLMIEIAETLSADFDFVRVDFYMINDIPMFGELTFTPAAFFFLKEFRTKLMLDNLYNSLELNKNKY